jgi:hypothetical protein
MDAKGSYSGKGVNRPMRNSSYNDNKPAFQPPKHIRGGEKKVMKKSLKVLASAAMAFSVFSSVAMADSAATTTSTSTSTTATKTSKDFKDLAGQDAALLAKIDALLAKGVFEGVSNDTFGIDQNMTRAQFAKVLDLIYGINVDMNVKTSSFTDVKADDAANGWAIPYVEAAKKAGLIDGMTDTTFAPGDNVTLGQFATALVKGLGKKVDVTGTPWYADAIKQAVELKILPEGTDGSKVATRADLVVGAYGAQQAYADLNKPAQVSIASVKATGVKTVQVTLDRDVDTSKATLTLTKGTVTVATTTSWSDDKKSATLSLTDTKLSAGDYTVTLGGLDASAIKTATATFTAQDETVQKIEFVTASDTIAFTNKASITVKATNQYGENASFSAGSYSVIAGNGNDVNPTLSKNDDGTLKLTLNTAIKKADGTPVYQQNLSVIPVNIWFNDTHVSVSKNFTLGVAPFVTKLELGDVKYSNGSAINKQGETATFAIKLYDQYGGLIGTDSDAFNYNNLNVLFTPYETKLVADKYYTDTNYPNTPFVRVSLSDDLEKSGDYTAQVYYQGASATTKISVKSAAVANKITLGDIGDVIASGDTDVYIPVIAYDEAGNQLSVDDLIADKNRNNIKISVNLDSANYDAQIMNSGDHKGTIHLKNVNLAAKSVVSVTAYIATANVNSTATKTYTISDVRTPDHLKIVNVPAKSLVPGASSKFTIQVIDQYGKSMDKAYVTDTNKGLVTSGSANNTTIEANNVKYYADISKTGFDGATAFLAQDGNKDTAHQMPTTFSNFTDVSVASSTFARANDAFDILNNDYDIVTTTSAVPGTPLSFTVNLWKQVGSAAPVLLDSKTLQATVAQPTDSLTYSLNSIPALWNALDSGVITDSVYGKAGESQVGNTVSGDHYLAAGDQKNASKSKFAREITVSAKNANGDTVALPKQITAVTSSNTSVAQVVYNGAGQAFVIGNKAGTATISVSFKTIKGEIKTLSAPVTVKSDALAVDHIIAGNTGVQKIAGDGTANAWDTMDIQVYDNYGVEYEKQDAARYNYLLGVTWSVANVKNGTASVDQYGVITGTSGTTFDLIATSANGKTAITPVSIN